MKNKGTKAIFFTTILILSTATISAQFNHTALSKNKHGIINDLDGYVNIHKEMNSKSPVIGKIIDNYVFNYWEIPNSNWWLVLTQDGRRGYVYSNRIREITISNLEGSYSISFDYSPDDIHCILGIEKIIIKGDFVKFRTINNKEYKIKINSSPILEISDDSFWYVFESSIFNVSIDVDITKLTIASSKCEDNYKINYKYSE